MEKKFLILFTIMLSSVCFSQTSLDIVRASNYYSKACKNYTSRNYTSALSNLKLAEENLKGKTNKDLEYLKIMTNYRLKNFKEAYKLVKVYFEEGFSGNTQYFKNVDTYKEQKNIDYEEELTTIFTNLEDKFNLIENVNADDFMANLIAKIKNNMTTAKDYIKEASNSSIDKSLLYYYQTKHTRGWDTTYKWRYDYYKAEFARYKVTNNIAFYKGYGGADLSNSSEYQVKVYYKPTTSKITTSLFTYGYKYDKTEYVSGQTKFYGRVYESKNSYQLSNTKATQSFIDIIEKENFTNSYYLEKTYKIYFTEDEQIVLSQDYNLSKLKRALAKENLL
ncbi:hypothetical protein [Polaribacter dokdonensis]|uniref:Uncharacterized protein n=1 Tax=Polaribacter dokdonensis DSW-5 TaxID=1300348 RepID=A0A0M9CGB3_9FLAO|nr:hypothetical protein [Polaribacter dokdonensis]KOY51962.1 hypothetical protein I602_1522 [Polaribacter dokdonensis DSW-5]SED98886.1 hypothetical protein SAMN05444353_0244 [Polaribacter dokdonensis DSW-5]